MNKKVNRKTIEVPYYELIIDLGDDFISQSLFENEKRKLKNKKIKSNETKTKKRKSLKKISNYNL